MNNFRQWQKELVGPELDYPFLIHHLQGYSKPRDKITRLLKNGDLIRVKKGLYVLGESHRQQLVSLEVLANLIYGPSYLSLEYALSFYGLIPERVECLTSMTTQKNKVFKTPLGVFSYRHLASHKYHEGLVLQSLDGKRHFIIASPEKAIADILDHQKSLTQTKEVLEFLIDNQRIEEYQLRKLSLRNLTKLAKIYDCAPLGALLKWLNKSYI